MRYNEASSRTAYQPLLFNIHLERIFDEAVGDIFIDIRIKGESINNVRYAHDTLVSANSIEHQQELMNRITETSEEYGLSINEKRKYRQHESLLYGVES